jgi:hypothetical protein
MLKNLRQKMNDTAEPEAKTKQISEISFVFLQEN